jgi:hypothetical protein
MQAGRLHHNPKATNLLEAAHKRITMIETNPTLKPPLGSGGGQIARAAICALVFLAGGSIVYWTAARQTAAPKNYQATATIVEHSPTAGGPNTVDLIRTFRPDPEAIKRQVLSDASLGQIAASGRPGASPASTPANLESVRRHLNLSSSMAGAGSCVLRIEATDGHRDQALRLVNELARRYAEAYRAAGDAIRREADDRAARAVRQGREQWQEAMTERKEFLRRPPPVETRPEKPKAAPPPAKRRWVDNPLWVELQRGHDDLVRRREELLVKRTPLHPEVLVVNDLIAESEAKMASVPRRVPVGSADAGTRGHGDTGTVSLGGHAGMAAAKLARWNQRRLALDAAVQQAQERLDQALRAERTNQDALRRMATVELHLADRCEVVAAGSPVPWRFLPMALASGLALATAAGMFFTGLSIDPLVTGVEQLQATLPSPLLGPVPVPAGCGVGPAVSEARSAPAFHARGAILVVVCILANVFAFALA